MENKMPTYLETHDFSHKTFMVSFQKLNKLNMFLSISMFLLGLLLELRFIVLLEVTCTLDATWGDKSKVTFGSSLKNNFNLKKLGTWRGAMALENPRMNVEYICNTQKHKEQDKMTRMRGRNRV